MTETVIQDLLEKHEKAHVADLAFVLDRLQDLDRGHNPDAEGRCLPAGLRRSLDLSRIGMLGPSLGGSAAARIAHDDDRVDAVVNLDGELLGPGRRHRHLRRFLLMSSESHTRDNRPTWNAFWAESTGWKGGLSFTGSQHASLAGSQHASFSDLQVILRRSQTWRACP